MTIGPYELNTIVQGDCLELMKAIPDKSCVVITDPPYGVKRDKGFEGFGGFGGFGKPIARRRFDDDELDGERPSVDHFRHIIKVSTDSLVFGGNYFADILLMSTHWIVWDKLNTMPTFGDCELVYTTLKRKSVKKAVFEWNGLIGKEEFRWHPTQKPLALMKWIVENYTKPDDIILDPFAGSGTTLVAAYELGRKFLGFELEPKYVAIANRRLDAVMRQERLFTP